VSAVLALIKKELLSVVHDRTIVIAIVIQLFIASFSSALLIGMLSLYDPDSVGVYSGLNLPVALVTPLEGVVPAGGQPGDPLAGLLRERGVKVVPFATLNEAQAAFNQGSVRAILNTPTLKDGLVELKLYLPRSQATSSMIQMTLQDPLKRYEVYLRQQRGIDVRYTGLKGQAPTSFEFIYSVLIPVLMFFPAFIAGSMVVDTLSEEMENNTLPTLLSTPLSANRVVAAKIVAAVLLAGLQSAAWLGMLALNRINIQNVGLVLLLALLTAAMAATASAAVACLFHDRERSQFIYSLGLLIAAGLSYLLDISPVRTISRLALGDAYTGLPDVLIFAAVLAALSLVLLRVTRRLMV